MGQPFIGEIRIFAGNFAPAGWALCDGRTLNIADYDTLYSLIGTTYGGDGQQTFNVPDLRGRVPMHVGQGGFNLQLGQSGGVEEVTLLGSQLGGHTHPLIASGTSGTANTATGTSQLATLGPGTNTAVNVYAAFDSSTQVALNGASISATGGSGSHTNIQPSLAFNFIISLFGIYPSQS